MKNPKRVAAGKKGKRKGNANERALAKLFAEWWGHGEWARTPMSGGWANKEVREGFRTCGDVITTAPDFPFCLEAKKQEGWTLDQLIHNDACVVHAWWKQAVEETPPGLVPLLIIARNHIPQAVVFAQEQMEGLCMQVERPRDGHELAWSAHPCFIFEDHPKKTFLVITALENFMKVNPDIFGRRLPNVEPATGSSQANGQA